MPKRKLKPVRSLGGLKKATLPKRKTSALARPKPMTGKKFSSKLTSKASIGGVRKGKMKPKPPIPRPPKPPAPKPPGGGGGGKRKPPAPRRRPRY